MAVKLAKKKPKWLAKIHDENVASANRAFQGRCEFVIAFLEFVEHIEDINDEFGTKFKLEDIFEITQEDEQTAIDMMEGDEDEDGD